MERAYPVVEADAFAHAREAYEELVRELSSEGGRRMTHGDVEQRIGVQGTEVLRRLFQGHLDLRALTEARCPVTDADGYLHTHRRDTERKLETLFGTVVVRRQAWNGRELEALHPLDAQLNLPLDHFSEGVRHRVCEEALGASFERTADMVSFTTGARVAKRQCEELVVAAAQDFDAFYDSTELVEDADDDLLVMSFDGKGVVMRLEALRPATMKAAMAGTRKLETRLSKGERPNRTRIAMVAAVYSVKPDPRTAADVLGADASTRAKRPKARNKRVWASLVKEPADVIEAGFREALSRDPKRRRCWAVLVDGNATQIRLVKRAARKYRVNVTLVLDVVHVIEYLWKAAWCLFAEGDAAAEHWVQERIGLVLAGRAGRVAGGMRRSATMRGLSASARKPLDVAAGYFLTHAAMMRYERFLAAGLPIATGVIEGACRHLVKDRMDITGARWGLEGAEAVLRMRALHSSGDLDDYWSFHARREFERNHLRRYAADEFEDHPLREAA